MHLRKSRKAKVAASEFVKRVISGKDVSPERTEASPGKGSRPSTPKQKSQGSVSRSQSKSPSRGRPSSPKPARSNSPKASSSNTPSTSTQRAASRSPSRAPQPSTSSSDTKPTAKKTQPPVKGTRPRGRPRKNRKIETKEPQPKIVSVPDDEDIKEIVTIPQVEAVGKGVEKKGSQSAKSSPAAKVISSSSPVNVPDPEDVKSSNIKGIKASTSGASDLPEISVEVPMADDGSDSSPSPTATTSSSQQSSNIITPKIVFVDSEGGKRKQQSTPSTSSKPILDLRSVTPLKAGQGIKISPTTKLLPVSLPNLGSVGPGTKGAFTISKSSLLSLASQGGQLIVNADGTLSTSPISFGSSPGDAPPGQIQISLVEIARSMAAMASQNLPSAALIGGTPKPIASSGTPIYKKSPKLLLSASKHGREEMISEGKIKKRRRSKTPAWEVPSAVYQTQFESPPKEYFREVSPIKYPEDKGMEQKEYFDIMGIVNKADVKKNNGKEHRNHRLAGGKLRRVCKPKISPEMVYRKFSLARGCVMQDVLLESDEEHDGNSPRVGDKTAVIKTEQSKKGSLSPKMHDSYRQHCSRIPVITIEKVNKEASGSEGQGTYLVFKENEPPIDKELGEGSSSGTTKSKKAKDKTGQFSKNGKSSKPGPKAKQAVGKGLSKSKSFEVPKKGTGKAGLIKVKSMPPIGGKKSKVKARIEEEDEKEEEADDGTKRRSARFKGSKRKKWWHLLRANPDEYEEDQEWNKEVALIQAKKQARIDRRRKREEEGEDLEEEDFEEDEEGEEIEEEEVIVRSPKKGNKKGRTEADVIEIKEEPEEEEMEASPPKPKPKKKKKKRSLDERQARGCESGMDDHDRPPSKKEGIKRKSGETSMEPPYKRIKDEPLSDQGSDYEPEDKRIMRCKRKKAYPDTEDDTEDRKPDRDIIILGEDGEPLDNKAHSGVYDQIHEILENRDPEDLASEGVLELLPVPRCSPQSFIEILARQQQLRRPPSPIGMLPIIRSDVQYKTKNSECIAPHICSVCWINDHMYCRNMKRIARDLPLSGRCIHYVPCDHFRQKESPSVAKRKKMNRKLFQATSGGRDIITIPSSVARKISFTNTERTSRGSPDLNDQEELLCEEILTESDSEIPSPDASPPPGTELLKYELQARAGQLKRSLGSRRLPLTISPLKRKLQGWVDSEQGKESEGNGQEVAIEDYGLAVELGVDIDPIFVPLSGEYIIEESKFKKEGWMDDTSVFMPNTEDDARLKDSEENIKGEPSYKEYEEFYGENSQDSTETSLSHNSVHEDSDDSSLDHEEAARQRKQKKKKKRAGTSNPGAIKLDHSNVRDGEAMQNKWQQSEDGTQVLTFTTKEIRERKPELLNYVKRAGLVGVITDKLQSERVSIHKLVKDSDQSLRQSQDKLEQHRCLMAAVLTEIVAVKEQLGDLATALTDEETTCIKLRKENDAAEKQVAISARKLKIMERIVNKAKEQLPNTESNIENVDPSEEAPLDSYPNPAPEAPLPEHIPMDASDSMVGVQENPGVDTVSMATTALTSTLTPTTTTTPTTITIPSADAMNVDTIMDTSEGPLPIILSTESLAVTSADSVTAKSEPPLDNVSIGHDMNLTDVTPVPSTPTSRPESAMLSDHTGLPSGISLLGGSVMPPVSVSSANIQSQLVNVQIDGGQGDGRMVMLQLPLDSTNISTTQANTILTGVHLDKHMSGQALLGEQISSSGDLTQIVSDGVLPEMATKPSKPLENLIPGQSGDHVSTGASTIVASDLKAMPILPQSIFGDNLNIQDVNVVPNTFQAQDLCAGTLTPSQPIVSTASLTLGENSNFEGIILQSEINDVLQTSGLTDLSLQQTDLANLIVQQQPASDLNNLMVSHVPGTKQSDIGNVVLAAPGDLKQTGLHLPVSAHLQTLTMDSVNLGSILTDPQQLETAFLQPDGLNLQPTPQQPGQEQQDQNIGNSLLLTSVPPVIDQRPVATTSTTSILLRPSPPTTITPSTSVSNPEVMDDEMILENLQLTSSDMGQVQTIMINGEPFEVVLRPTDQM